MPPANAQERRRRSPRLRLRQAPSVMNGPLEAQQSDASPTLYDSIGATYSRTRRADPRITEALLTALGDARSLVNVGAGVGAYEPSDRQVLAVEPSRVMLAQRLPTAAPAIRASAERLPLADNSFDAAMAVLSDLHWADRARGLCELRRVARERVVVLTLDVERAPDFWLVRDYLPGAVPKSTMTIKRILEHLGGGRSIEVPIPRDCRDGFIHAFWRRPEAFLDPTIRASMSFLASLPARQVDAALERLRRDINSGAWANRNGELLELEALDCGYRLVIADP
jgi:SAM-dependent methyltransferase